GVGCEERHVPAVGVPRRRAQRELLARAADPERQPLLDGLRLAAGVTQMEELAVEVGDVLGEQRAYALDPLVEHAEPNGDGWKRDAVRVVLALVPSAAEAEHDASTGEVVEGGHGVREHGGMAVAHRVHEASAGHPLGLEREGGVRGHRFEAHGAAGRVGCVEVVPDRDPVETVAFDPPPQRAQLVGRRVLEPGVDAEPHAAPNCAPTPGMTSAAMSRRCSRSDTSRTWRFAASAPAVSNARSVSTTSSGRPAAPFARSSSGSRPMAFARRRNSASSRPQHTTSATVVRSVAGSRPESVQVCLTRSMYSRYTSSGGNARLNSWA